MVFGFALCITVEGTQKHKTDLLKITFKLKYSKYY